MRPALRVFLAVLGATAIAGMVAACGSGDDDDSQPRATSTNSQSSPTTGAPTEEPEEDAVPQFEDGPWTEGEARVTLTGATTLSMTGTLFKTSATDGRTTRLVFTDELDTLTISISTQYQPFDLGVRIGDVLARPGDVPCVVTYIAREEDHVEGTFTCEDAEDSSSEGGGTLRLEGSFRATR